MASFSLALFVIAIFTLLAAIILFYFATVFVGDSPYDIISSSVRLGNSFLYATFIMYAILLFFIIGIVLISGILGSFKHMENYSIEEIHKIETADKILLGGMAAMIIVVAIMLVLGGLGLMEISTTGATNDKSLRNGIACASIAITLSVFVVVLLLMGTIIHGMFEKNKFKHTKVK